MSGYRRPDAKRLGAVLAMVAGDGAEAVAAADAGLAASHHGRYVNPDGELVAVCECTIGAAAGLGCALALIPAGGCEDMVAAGRLSDAAGVNLHEVFNMLATLMVDDNTPHLRLDTIAEGPASEPPGEARTAFDVTLKGWGAGRIGFAHR